MTTRRNFIKTGCAACLGLGSFGVLLEACSASMPLLKITSSDTGILKIPSEKFSVSNTMLIVRSSKLENDILLLKKQGSFKALYLHCTHENQPLTPTSSKIYCTAHGSEFDLEGNVLKEPALKPLKQFRTEEINNEIIIHLI